MSKLPSTQLFADCLQAESLLVGKVEVKTGRVVIVMLVEVAVVVVVR